MIRKIAVLVLLAVITVTAVVGIVLYQQKKQQEQMNNHLHLAEAAIAAGNHEQALQYLKPLVEAGKKYEKAEVALYQLAVALQQTNPKEAYTYWDQLVRDYPGHEKFDDARLYQARMLADSKPNDALAIFEELKKSTDSKISGEAILGIAKTHDLNNETQKAEELYYAILDLNTLPEIIAAAKDRLTEINTGKIWNPALDEFNQLYEVQRGDSFAKIGQLFKTTAWYVQEANGMKGVIRPGRRLKVPAEPYRVVVDKTNCRLNLVTMSGKFVKWYPVGVGEQSYKTPAGLYKIINKEVDPVWYRPTGGIIPKGDPENALGTRWMGIGSSLGIHGTNQPETIGYKKSAGCIRMHNHDAEELYKILTYGSIVTITETDEQLRSAMNPVAVDSPESIENATGETTTTEGTETAP